MKKDADTQHMVDQITQLAVSKTTSILNSNSSASSSSSSFAQMVSVVSETGSNMSVCTAVQKDISKQEESQKLDKIAAFFEQQDKRKQKIEAVVKRYVEEANKQTAEVKSHISAADMKKAQGRLETLYDRWCTKDGLARKNRLVRGILKNLHKPEVVAAIVDNIEYFVKICPQKDLTLWLLDIACICGSAKVTKYMISEMSSSTFSVDDAEENALHFASAYGDRFENIIKGCFAARKSTAVSANTF